jgi:16S rRNA (cytosine1402-N4)-methyltransferase
VTAHPSFAHASVLAADVARLLGGCRRVVDGTVGAGGHARLLLDAGAEVLAFDRDPAAVAAARDSLGGRVTVRRLEFSAAARDPAVAAFRPDGVLLDLGVSSPQIDDETRGFTFRRGAPLDMRMDGEGPTAAEWLNAASEAELAHAFAAYGDEPRARSLARTVARRRAAQPLATSDDLVGAIRAVLGPRSGPPDFARLFQAVRIALNDEIGRLEAGLEGFRDVLVPGGALAVIAYHSGEDRVVKHTFREWARACVCPQDQPVCTCRGRPLGALLTRRAVRPTAEEIAANPRARSARLRAFRTAA